MSLGLSILTSFAALAAAALVHWALWRGGRRFPVALARWVSTRRTVSASEILAWQRNADLLVLPLKLAVWVVAFWFVSHRFVALAALVDRAAEVLRASFSRPLFTIGEQQFSAFDFLLLPVALAALWFVVGLVSWFFRTALLGSTRIEPSVKESVSNLLRYSLLFVGGIVVLQLWGLDASTLAIAGSALGVGLGFGLRNIANNFVSGVLIGLERPIKIGDYVEVGKFAGTVIRIGGRSTEIRTQDRVTILVPNSLFLETEVINWSHGDPTSRLRVQVGVAYGTPIGEMRAALLEVGRRHPEVLDDPAPEVQLAGFGDSALLFELLVWTDDPREQYRIRSDLHFGVEAALRRAGIEIPFPHRVLQISSTPWDGAAEEWTRREFPDSERAPRRETARKAPPEDSFDFSRRTWTDPELEALGQKMRGVGGQDGVGIQDRRYLLNLYPRCFVGRDAVAWLERNVGLGRREAIHLGRLMVERRIFHHVLDEHPFDDGGYFYRFYADEKLDG